MKTQALFCALFALSLFVCQASLAQLVAQQPGVLPPIAGADVVAKDKDKEKDKDKDKDKKPEKKPDAPKFDPFPVTSAIGDFMIFNPGMMGQQPPMFARQRISVF